MPSRLTGGRGIARAILDLGARRWWLVNATPQPLYPRERETAHIVQVAGWASGPVWMGPQNLTSFWMGPENLAPTGFRSLDRPAR
jgi:hypothetical protein